VRWTEEEGLPETQRKKAQRGGGTVAHLVISVRSIAWA